MSLLTRARLRSQDVTDRQIARLIDAGRLERLRGGVYADADVEAAVRAAVRAGGRLACASELRRLGAWVLDERLHVHFSSSRRRLGEGVRHWRALTRSPSLGSVSALDAVIQATDCLDRRAAVAALDSALHQGLVSARRLGEAPLPPRSRAVLRLADGRAESGLESLARLIARDLGFRALPQAVFDGIGRVDLLIEGAVVVEADGDLFHSDIAARRRDRRRDALLAGLGHPVLRFGYDQLVGRPAEVARALIETVARHPGVKDSRSIARRARIRAENTDWA